MSVNIRTGCCVQPTLRGEFVNYPALSFVTAFNEKHPPTPISSPHTCAGVQTVEEILAILRDAPIKPVPAIDEDEQYEDLVDEMVQQEPSVTESMWRPQQGQAPRSQQQQQQQQGLGGAMSIQV